MYLFLKMEAWNLEDKHPLFNFEAKWLLQESLSLVNQTQKNFVKGSQTYQLIWKIETQKTKQKNNKKYGKKKRSYYYSFVLQIG